MISVITPTGGRPEAFRLCEKWMGRQTYTDFEWIVVDDGIFETETMIADQVIRPAHRWNRECTLGLNLLASLDMVQGDAVLICEDDDHYAPDYVKTMAERLQHHDLVGEIPARYYNVKERRYHTHANTQHASLCQTGFRASLIPQVIDVIKGTVGPFIDIALWKLDVKKALHTSHLCTGIKGMPGRAGIGMGHKSHPGWTSDPNCDVLREWIGDDAEEYLEGI